MSEPIDVIVIPHTHWDREWYHSAGVFRQRLVALIDELLDAPAAGARTPNAAPHAASNAAPNASFLLDGQAVALDDYLAVRPERSELLAERLRSGALEAGPWYVLADELMPSGEALVRNLLAGRRTLAAFGASAPPVLYSPDAFGHTAALPTLAEGFGFPLTIVWRGYGGARWPDGDAFWWTATDGARVLAIHLPPDGYEYGSSLPTDATAARDRWHRMRDVLAPRARLGVLLVQNGADHHARQQGFDAALGALRDAAAPDRVRHASLREYAKLAVERAADAELPVVHGELRDSYGYTWTLQGTFASRAAQKRRNAGIERILLRDVEPWLALTALREGPHDAARALLHAAWRTLLLNHPHDTLCGCSTDEVARAADARYDDAESQAVAFSATALATLLGYDADAARERRDAWVPRLVVRNASARRRGGVAEVELTRFVRDEGVGPGSGGTWPRVAPLGAPPLVAGGAVAVQPLARTIRRDRIESPRHYPDNDIVESIIAVAWLPPMDGYSLRSLPLGTPDIRFSPDGPSEPVALVDGALENGHLTLAVDETGCVSLRWKRTGFIATSLIAFEDVGEAGDLYTHSPIGRPLVADVAPFPELVASEPLRGEVVLRYRVRVPREGRDDRAEPPGRPTHRTETITDLPIEVRLVLDADAQFVRVHVRGENTARDHRLRIVFRTGVRTTETLADAAFGPVVRRPLDVPVADAIAERPPRTAPLHRWVSLSDGATAATVVSDGLAEYEATPEGDVAITLVRSVGELSRRDLPERPGHAGWPVHTPQAQSLGPFAASFAIALHSSHDAAESMVFIERLADDVLQPLRGETLRSAIDLPHESGGLTLEGDGLAFSAAKPSDDGAWIVLRCVNLTDAPVDGAWRLRVRVHEARLARLDETLGAPLNVERTEADACVVRIAVPARGVHTVCVR